MTTMKFLGVIQARMGSTRLPGKSLAKLGDKAVLEWVCRRAMKSELVEKWVVATSEDESSDSVAAICRSIGIEVVRGSETNVLSRFAEAIRRHEPQYVVRVCADNPFVWGPLIDDLIRQVREGDVYLANHRPHQFCSVADGFGAELISAGELVELAATCTDSSVREHVTISLVSRHPSRVVDIDDALNYPYLRFDVDTQQDLARLNALTGRNSVTLDSHPSAIIKTALEIETQEVLEDLFPLNRSLAGDESRKTLKYLNGVIPLRLKHIQTGSKVFDWEVPPEWFVQEGWIVGRSGTKLVDFKQNHLHVISYSAPVDRTVDLEELQEHIHVHALADAVPYRTSYYKRDWGFAVSQKDLGRIVDDGGPFHVLIRSGFRDGYLDYADLVIPGTSKREVLVSSYFCHPSLANDSLSGVILATFLARHLLNKQALKFTYRFAFVPETIGALAYLQELGDDVSNIYGGLQVTTVGGPGDFQLKKSWNPEHPINRIARNVLEASGRAYTELDFDIHGSDERQYSSPAFRVNMLTIAKDIYYSYPQYHSSLDNLDFVNGRQICESLRLYIDFIHQLESSRTFVRTDPRGEPMLGKRDIYRQMGGSLLPIGGMSSLDLILWVLFLCDGIMTTSDVALKLNLNPEEVKNTCELLVAHGLLKEI